jgi:hypothetical protein
MLAVKVDQAMFAAVRKAAHRAQETTSEWLRQAIAVKLEEKKRKRPTNGG